MIPKNQNKRISLILFCGSVLGIGSWLLLSALNQNTQFFYDPSEILAEGFSPKSDRIRVGGLVLENSVVKGEALLTTFKISDFPDEDNPEVDKSLYITVTYSDILPDLFREGQGVVVTGDMITQSEMVAADVLAKHDENYQPKK